MTDPLARIRATALAMPEVEERADGGDAVFAVADAAFARWRDGALHVRGDDGWAGVALTGDVDWVLVNDRIARGWELAAPARLLEAGGR